MMHVVVLFYILLYNIRITLPVGMSGKDDFSGSAISSLINTAQMMQDMTLNLIHVDA